jgi:Ser/Thr protein kinase RdoA (MazF antagonist)
MSGDDLPGWATTADIALAGYGLEGCRWDLISVRENAVFRVTTPTGATFALRLCRPGYRSAGEVESETAWVSALSDEGIVRVPTVFPDESGKLVHTFSHGGVEQTAILSEFIRGEAASSDERGRLFFELGSQTALLHEHGASWIRPRNWTRPRWDLDALIGAKARWGDWRESRQLTTEDRSLFEEVEVDIRRRMTSPGAPLPDSLVHADLHPGNVLVSDGRLVLLDFDDCGLSWPLWDLACAIVDDCPNPARASDWLAGYASVRTLTAVQLETAAPLIMLRLIMVVGWMESHDHVFTAVDAVRFVGLVADLAEQYLGGELLTPEHLQAR